jgi:RHS repeat-associated protein
VTPKLREEIASFRTRYSDTFATGQGFYVAQVRPGPINYQAANASWRPIDDSLAATSTGYRNRADAYRVDLPSSLRSGPVRVSQGGDSVSMQLLGATAGAAAAGSAASYANALPGVSASYEATPGGVKETLTLARPTVAPIKVMVRLSSNLGVAVRAGSVRIEDLKGKTVFMMPTPYMVESPAHASTESVGAPVGSVAVTSTPAVGGVLLTYTPDAQWLNASGRQFPVIMDPSVSTTSAPNADCTIVASSPTFDSWCGSGSLDYVGTGGGGGQGIPTGTLKTMISFPGGLGLPADSQVLGATLKLDVASIMNTTRPVQLQVFPMTTPFTPSLATWNTSNGSKPWLTLGGGGDYSTALQASATVTGPGSQSLNVTPMTQNWLDGSNPIPQMMIAPINDPQGYAASIYNHASGGNGPYLQIEYAPRLGAPRAATVETTQLNDRTQLRVNVGDGNVVVSDTDLNIAGTGIDQTVARDYNNLAPAAAAGSWGAGWGNPEGGVPQTITWFAGDAVTFTATDGTQTVFTTDGAGGLTAPGIDAQLCTNTTQPNCGNLSSTESRLTLASGETLNFSTKGAPTGCGCEVLATALDRNGHQLTYNYTPFPMRAPLLSLTDTQSRTTTWSYSPAGFISSLADVAGARTVGYTQDANGLLKKYTDAAGNSTIYGYDALGNLTQINDPAGEITILGYEPGGNRVTSIKRVTNNATLAGDTTNYAYYGPAGPGGGWPSCGQTQQGVGNPIAYGSTLETDPNGHSTLYCYDTHDRVFTTVDAQQNQTSTSYNADDDVVSSTQPSGPGNAQETSTTQYDGCQRPSEAEAPLATNGSPAPATTSSTYNTAAPCSAPAAFSPLTTTDAEKNVTTNTYDAHGNLRTIVDPLTAPNTTVIHYDPNTGLIDYTQDPIGYNNGNQPQYKTSYGYTNGNLTSVTPPTPLGPESYTYDAVSRVTTHTDGNNQKTTFNTYDALDRLKLETHPDGSTTAFTYDNDGNLLTQTDSATGTTTYTYDRKNRELTEASPDVSNTYTYDPADNLATVLDATQLVTYSYNSLNQLKTVVEPGSPGPTTSFQYDAVGRPICTTLPNGVVVQDEYTTTGQLSSTKAANGPSAACNPAAPTGTPAGTVFSWHSYSYIYNGFDTALRYNTTINGSTTNYRYDGLNRVISAATSTAALCYAYDGNGNLLTTSDCQGHVITSHTYDATDRIAGFGYDTAGNVLTRPDAGGSTALGYNSRNQTTSVNPDNTAPQTLSYLGEGQTEPTQIGNAPSGGTPPTLGNNALGISHQAAATLSGGQAATTYYTREPDGTLLGERTPTGNYYYVPDGNGSVVAMTNSTGGVTNTYSYDAYGNTTSTGVGTLTGTNSAPNSFGFDGSFAALGHLDLLGARYYDPSVGAWTQPDPNAHPTDPTQASSYSFAGDDPVNNVDPTGNDYYWYTSNLSTAWAVGQALVAGGIALSKLPLGGPLIAAIQALAGSDLSAAGDKLIACANQKQKKKQFYSCELDFYTWQPFGFDTCVPIGLSHVFYNSRRRHSGCFGT